MSVLLKYLLSMIFTITVSNSLSFGEKGYRIISDEEIHYPARVKVHKHHIATEKSDGAVVYLYKKKQMKQVKDGGHIKKIYIEITHINRLMEKSYEINDKGIFHVYLSEQYTPSRPRIYQRHDLHGQVKVLKYIKKTELALHVTIRYQPYNKVKTVVNRIIRFKNIPF